MSLILPDNLPAIELLKQENIMVSDGMNDPKSHAPALKVGILNLMPIKETTELDLLRLLSNTHLQIEVSLMKLRSHVCKHTSKEHMDMFYTYFDDFEDDDFDGLIITGAPVELIDFEEVDYWEELTHIFRWAETHVQSTLFICWAAQAGLYFHYGIPKYPLAKKKFGIFQQHTHNQQCQLLRGFDDIFYMPHSRHTEIREEDVKAENRLTILADSADCGASLVMAKDCRQIFITGHLEYSPYTLDGEYKRDCGKRNDVDLPENYYKDNDPAQQPIVTWRAHANLMYYNWIHHILYQNKIAGKSQE